jgi:hypothetical protein
MTTRIKPPVTAPFLQPFSEYVLVRPLKCCGSRIVIRTHGQRWMCPCGRKHKDGFIRKMQSGA